MKSISQLHALLCLLSAVACTPLQKEAWRAGQEGRPFPSSDSRQSSSIQRALNTERLKEQVVRSYRPVRRRAVYSSPSDLYVKKKIDNGKCVLLNNGILMEIDPLETIDSMLWLALDEVNVISSNRGSPGYDQLIINLGDKTHAHARTRR